MMDAATARRVLDLPMEPNGAGALTIREYLLTLVEQVWEHDEGFSGKRPFGDSGWKWEVYEDLARAGVVGVDGVDAPDASTAQRVISDAIAVWKRGEA